MTVNIKLQGNNHYLIAGELNLTTVAAALQDSAPIFHHTKTLILDLAEVTHTDSAAVALLLEWLRLAHVNQITISYRNLPAKLLAVAAASGVANLLTA